MWLYVKYVLKVDELTQMFKENIHFECKVFHLKLGLFFFAFKQTSPVC